MTELIPGIQIKKTREGIFILKCDKPVYMLHKSQLKKLNEEINKLLNNI